MNGMDAVRHGVSMLLRNLGPAIRVSLGPVILALVVSLVLGAVGLGGLGAMTAGGGELSPEEAAAMAGRLGWGAFVGSLIVGLVWLFALSWVAVAWHRYVLLEEESGLLPPLRQDLVWPYLGRTILLAILLLLLSIPLGLLLASVLATGNFLLALVGGTVLWLVLGWVGLRLSLVLPARAVDRPMTFGESWSATAPASGGILVVALLLGVINVALGLLLPAIFGFGIVAQILSLLVQWFSAMLGLSVLSTLYGHLVERRALAA